MLSAPSILIHQDIFFSIFQDYFMDTKINSIADKYYKISGNNIPLIKIIIMSY